MKHLTILIAFTLLSLGLVASEIDGQWNGMLDIYGTKLRIVVHITETDSGLVATLDSPDQGAYDLLADSVSYADSKVNIVLKQLDATYDGTLEGDKSNGTLRQAWL